MHVNKENIQPQAKSYTSIHDIFGSTPFTNVLYRNPKKCKDVPLFQATCGDSVKKHDDSQIVNQSIYVTSEKYHKLNKDYSYKSIIHSTSTIFYDLDDLVKRHSFNCITELNTGNNVELHKVINYSLNSHGFKGKSNAIVQECATQIHPKLIVHDSIEINTRKIVNKKIPNDAVLSSEIFLRDDDTADVYDNAGYYDTRTTDRHQKFWSYAKYRTEYSKPEEKKLKKKDRGKRTEDPCPCQLFSYACPCTNKKSLTELAKNSRSLTVADQLTSTAYILPDNNDSKIQHSNKNRNNSIREDKLTSVTEINDKHHIVTSNNVVSKNMAEKQEISKLNNDINESMSIKSKVKSSKRPRKIICPKCKENVEIISSTEEEESLRFNGSSVYKMRGIPSKSACTYRTSPRKQISKIRHEGDLCDHDPRCEFVPVCQILPTSNVYVNHKCIRKSHTPSPRVIRITKACRHHPPCTLVPSCQRANVLKNNCEFIPPCLHRPRCVNLPLCVPFSKCMNYEELLKNVDDLENSECPHIPRCKYVPECQQDVVNGLENPIEISHTQNPCELLNDFHTPAFMLNPRTACITKTFSPCLLQSQIPCDCCKTNKSCQYDCLDCICNPTNIGKEGGSRETVIFIRDVGCQFRNKNYNKQKESTLKSKLSNDSLDFVDVNMGNYYTNVHTLRYEDKFTNPISREDASISTTSVTSEDLDAQCPSHGHKISRGSHLRNTGFDPKPTTSPYVAYTTQTVPIIPAHKEKIFNNIKKEETLEYYKHNNVYPVKSRKNLKTKYKKMFSMKRRKRSRVNSQILWAQTKRSAFQHSSYE